MTIRKYLGDKHADDGSLADRVGCDETKMQTGTVEKCCVKKAHATKPSPPASRSISQRPTKVKTRLVRPMRMDCNSAAFAAKPVSSKMRGAKYRIALMPES
jgi:hypothetical protein